MTRSVFICAAWSWAHHVRAIHSTLASYGIAALSEWAATAHDGPEGLEQYSVEDLRGIRELNFAGIAAADVVMFLADSPAREGFIEVCHALFVLRKPVIWIGRDTLSTSCDALPGVTRVRDVAEAIAVVRGMAKEAA